MSIIKNIIKFSTLAVTLAVLITFSVFKINKNLDSYTVAQYFLPSYYNSGSDMGGGFDFEEWIDHTKKDVNSDGAIDALDLTEVKKILLEIVVPEDLVGDTNDSGSVDIRDLIYLKRYLSEH